MHPDAPSYLREEEIVELHRQIIGRVGGIPGIRDSGALKSCVAQAKTAVFGQERFPTLFDKSAAYCFFIARMHPFLDGNKRTAFLAALHFLLKNGITPTFDEDEMYEPICGAATGKLDIEELAQIFRKAAQR